MVSSLVYSFLWLSLNLLRALGLLRWRVEGLEHIPPGGVVLVANHVHWLDIPVHGTLMPFRRRPRWVAKAELLRAPAIRLLLSSFMIPIQRGKRDTEALDHGVEALREGHMVLIYPEGTRSRTGILQKGKPGALVLAAQSGCPLVPLALIGTEQGLGGSLRRREVLLRVGKPFVPPSLDGKNPSLRTLSQHTALMMQHIAELLPEDRRGPYAALGGAAPAATQAEGVQRVKETS